MQGKNTKFSAVIAYFEQLATDHVQIQHSPTSKHFARLELDEVVTGIQSRIKFPLLVLEGYSFSLRDPKSDNVMKQRSGAFMLLTHVKDKGDYNLIHETWDFLEEIGDDIIARMKQDKRNPASPIRNFNFDSVEGSLISFDANMLYGIRYTYDIETSFPAMVDPDKWLSPDNS